MPDVKFDLYSVRKKLELAKGRDYSWGEIAEGAGLSRNTVETLATNDPDRAAKGVRFDTIIKLLAYFRRQGLKDLKPGDFLIEIDQEPTTTDQTSAQP